MPTLTHATSREFELPRHEYHNHPGSWCVKPCQTPPGSFVPQFPMAYSFQLPKFIHSRGGDVILEMVTVCALISSSLRTTHTSRFRKSTDRQIWGVKSDGHVKNEPPPLRLLPIFCLPPSERSVVPPGFPVPSTSGRTERERWITRISIRLSHYPPIAKSRTRRKYTNRKNRRSHHGRKNPNSLRGQPLSILTSFDRPHISWPTPQKHSSGYKSGVRWRK